MTICPTRSIVVYSNCDRPYKRKVGLPVRMAYVHKLTLIQHQRKDHTEENQEHQLHNSVRDGTPNSPPCNTFSDAGSMSIYEPETVTISFERVGQIIENYNSHVFNGSFKNPNEFMFLRAIESKEIFGLEREENSKKMGQINL